MANNLTTYITDQLEFIQNRLGELASQAERVDMAMLNQVRQEYGVHRAIVEDILFPALRDMGDVAFDLKLIQEFHQDMGTLFDEVVRAEGEERHKTLSVMSDIILNQVDELHETLFPMLLENLSPEQLRDLSVQVKNRLQKESVTMRSGGR